MSNTKKENVSRREFLKQAGAALGGITLVSLAATSCENTPASPNTNTGTNTNTSTALLPSPPSNPPLVELPGCGAYIATDRKYSDNHIWVLPFKDNIVIVGVTEVFVGLAGAIMESLVEPKGTVLSATREDSFGYIHGSKITTDLISPVSGTILGRNEIDGAHGPVYYDPYVGGWLAIIQLSNPSELNKLYTPQYYAYLSDPSWDGPTTPMY